MNDALYIAATGMQMQQKNVETISNNMANVNTPGYKRGKVSFVDLVYRDINVARPDSNSAAMLQGSGVSIAAIFKSFAQGDLKQTSQPMDVAIQGEGFFEVAGADGVALYCRGGSLSIDKDGMLASPDGKPLKPAIHIGSDVREIQIRADGQVLARDAGQTQLAEVGHIELTRFADPAGLVPLGANLYQASARSGEPITGRPGEDGVGTLAQGFAESSNVKLVEEMVELMVAQRAYESNVKVVQAADEMLSMSNNLRK